MRRGGLMLRLPALSQYALNKITIIQIRRMTERNQQILIKYYKAEKR